MPFRHMHNAGGIALLVLAVVIAAVAGLASRGSARSSPAITIFAAIIGIILLYYLLRRL